METCVNATKSITEKINNLEMKNITRLSYADVTTDSLEETIKMKYT